MVVPLKLTQFYGHSVPRPRIYATVKFSEHRVDPPPSVNDALLSWASDAHWSMGGLAFKRLRAQGKVEGSVRRLRAFLEEDEDAPDAPEKAKAMTKEAVSKPAENVGKVKPTTVKEAGKPLERKRQSSEEDSVEATPSRKIRKREALEESTEEGSPAFVPATEEKLQKKLRAESAEVISANNTRKKGSRLPSKADVLEVETPSSVVARGERRREKLFSSSRKALGRSKSAAATAETSPASESEGRITRSGMKKPAREGASVSNLQPTTKGRPRARKILMRAGDEDSSESDDGLEAFLKEKGHSVRRSSRLVKEQGNSSQTSLSASDSDSE